jgi:hypothetical protein
VARASTGVAWNGSDPGPVAAVGEAASCWTLFRWASQASRWARTSLSQGGQSGSEGRGVVVAEDGSARHTGAKTSQRTAASRDGEEVRTNFAPDKIHRENFVRSRKRHRCCLKRAD